ncbi:hypothetical protein TNCV_3261611 [Trichonephila clavipes]|nr:hypothetical protein TNCV_3261611 [Trichonephila clavipes]
MTENDAPESTRARIGFLSIITSSWLPVILAVDGGFQYKRPHLLGRSLCLVFLAPTAWRLTGSAIWRRGSVTTYWGSASRGTWRKTERRVWSAYFFFSANVVEVPSAVSSCQRQPFSLGSSALHVRTSAVETNRSVVSRSPHICFSWFRWEFLNRSSVFPSYSGVCWSWSSFCRFC